SSRCDLSRSVLPITQRQQPQQHLVLFLGKVVDSLLACFVQHAVDERLLERRRDGGHLEGVHRFHEAIHQMLCETSDAALPASPPPSREGALAGSSPSHPTPPPVLPPDSLRTACP